MGWRWVSAAAARWLLEEGLGGYGNQQPTWGLARDQGGGWPDLCTRAFLSRTSV